jgi:hypothetical protein
MSMMKRKVYFSAVLGVCSCLLLSSGALHAEPVDAPSAEALFRAGRSAMQEGDYALACARFRESERLEHGVGNWLNLGLCEEKLGHWASAWDLYQRVLESVPVTDSRAQIARDQFQALDARVPKLVLLLRADAPPNTTVSRNEMSYEQASFGIPLPLDPGAAVFTVGAPGFAPREYRVTLEEGQHLELLVGPGPATATAAPPARPLAPPPPKAAHPTSVPKDAESHVVGWALVAGGTASLLVAGISGLALLHDTAVVGEDCLPDKSCSSERALAAANQGKWLNVLSPAALAVGVLATSAGLYLVLHDDTARAGTRVGAVATPSGAKLELQGSF